MIELYSRYPALKECEKDINTALEVLISTYRRGGKVLLCGNGGSCADCDHIAGELLKGFLSHRPVSDERIPEELREKLQGSLPAISLPSLSAALTASLNDLDPEIAYAQLLMGLGKEGDVLIALSTSGNAKNVFHAATLAKALGMNVIGMTGNGGGRLATIADVTIRAPECETYKIQEYHLPVYHYLCAKVEEALF